MAGAPGARSNVSRAPARAPAMASRVVVMVMGTPPLSARDRRVAAHRATRVGAGPRQGAAGRHGLATLRARHWRAKTSATTGAVASAARGIAGGIADRRRAAAVVVVGAVCARGREALGLA